MYDFALIKGLQIPNLTAKELTKLATEILEMQDVTIHILNTKLREINRNYPWVMTRMAEDATNNYLYHYRNNVHGCCNISQENQQL